MKKGFLKIVVCLFGLLGCATVTAKEASLLPVYENEDVEVLVANQAMKTEDGNYLIVLKTYLNSDVAKGSFMEYFEVGEVPAYKMEWIEFTPDWSQWALYALQAVDDFGNYIINETSTKPRTLRPVSSNETILNIVPMAKKFEVIGEQKDADTKSVEKAVASHMVLTGTWEEPYGNRISIKPSSEENPSEFRITDLFLYRVYESYSGVGEMTGKDTATAKFYAEDGILEFKINIRILSANEIEISYTPYEGMDPTTEIYTKQ